MSMSGLRGKKGGEFFFSLLAQGPFESFSSLLGLLGLLGLFRTFRSFLKGQPNLG